MKKIIQLTMASALCVAFSLPIEKVYVCDSETSVAYHQTKECKGLNRCAHEIIYITKKEAVDTYGKRACKLCY